MTVLNISGRTIQRAFQEIITGYQFEDGVNFIKNNPVKTLYHWIRSVIDSEHNIQDLIQGNTTLLATEKEQITGTILNTQALNSSYTCDIKIPVNASSSVSFTIRQSDKYPDRIEIIDKQNSDKVYAVEGISFAELKIVLLKKHIKEKLDSDLPADLSKLNLNAMNLSQIDLRNAQLGTENLKAITALPPYKQPSLVGATLKPGKDEVRNDTPYADASGLKFAFIKMDKPILQQLASARANLQKVNLSKQNLNGLVLPNGTDLTRANFTNAQVRNASCIGVQFNHARFGGADFSSSNLSCANLTGVITSNTKFIGTAVRGATQLELALRSQEKPNTVEQLKLNPADLKNLILDHQLKNFTGISLLPDSEETLDLSNLANHDLSEYNFTEAKLAKTNFSNVNLRKANLVKADLSNIQINDRTIIRGANLNGAVLANVDLTRISLNENHNLKDDDTSVQGIQLRGATLNESWIRQVVTQNQEKEKSVDLMQIKFSPATDLTNVNLSQFDLTDADLQNVIFNNTELNKSGFEAALTSRKSTKNLSNIILRGTADNLINLRELDLNSVDLSGATLEYCDFSGLDMSKINLSDSKLHHCKMSAANLTGANFSGAHLTYCDLSKANITRVNFTNAELGETILASASGADSTIIDNHDIQRNLYEKEYLLTLRYLINPLTHSRAIPGLSLTFEEAISLKNQLFFNLTQSSLNATNFKQDHAFTWLYKSDGTLNQDQIVSINDSKKKNTIQLKLGSQQNAEKFSDEQKRLFHWARAATWSVDAAFKASAENAIYAEGKQLKESFIKGKITAEEHAEKTQKLADDMTKADEEFHSRQVKNQIYLSHHPSNQRLCQKLMEQTFDAVYVEFQKFRPTAGLSLDEKNTVKNFFLHPQYHW